MKQLFGSFVIAFSMYSRIPMPRVEWTKERMRYALCFFPWIGVLIGDAELLLFSGIGRLGATEQSAGLLFFRTG
ncbi:MAG: adenosylcobinamide-GDP ribazoletransferase, partial [Clostridium sp.]|nr:adenosylcobinamide-GDP ribazoletransferase [Clostridium sp.]